MPNRPASVFLQRWALGNALLIGAALVPTVSTGRPVFVLAAGGTALTWLVLHFRGAWTPSGRFGNANTLTALRSLGTLLLPAVEIAAGGIALAGLSAGLLILDGVDGRIARARGEVSPFGEFFDKETDALMVLLLCVLLVVTNRLGSWILLAGGLRYLFVVAVFLGRPQVRKEQRSRFARFVYTLAVSALVAGFVLPPGLYVPLALGATVLLTLSFARSFWHVFAPA